MEVGPLLKKNKILLLLGTVLLLASSSFTAIAMENKEEERIYNENIASESKDIQSDYSSFNNEKDEAKRLDYFKSMVSEYNRYKKGNEKDEKIIKIYESYITKSKELFKNENIKVLLDNTTKDLEIETKDSLNEKINIISTLKEKVLSLEGLVYFGDEKEQFNNKTNKILKRYEEKIKQLDEAQAKVEAEAQVAVEAQAAVEAEAAVVAQAASVAEQQYIQESNSDSANYSSSNNYEDSNYDTGYTYVEPDSSSSYSSDSSSSTPTYSSSGTIEYGWSATTEGDVRNDTWVEQSADGSTYTVGTGNGTNNVDLGAGWIIP